MLTGWITGVGVLGPQAVDAINFYQNVVGKSIFPGTKPDGALSDSSEPEGQELSYSTRVRLDETRMQIEDKMVTLAPGMAVTVEIKTGTRRIIEYLMSPLLRYRQESLRER
jgi:hemolysin D